MIQSSSTYFMEDPREAERLELKVNATAWVEKYLADRVRSGAEVLSVGCGPGVILAAVTALDPTISGTGIDLSAKRVQQATERNHGNGRVKFVCGDAQAMQFESNSFDLVYCRMLMQYLKNKEQAVAEMKRVCKPGGTVLLQDLDGQLLWHYPEDEGVQRTAETVVSALAASGFDAFVGRKLFWLAQHAGLMNAEVQAESYHLIAGEVEPEILKQWELKLEIARPHLQKILGGEVAARKQIRAFLDYLKRPDTLTYSTQFTVTAEKSL
jgi:ubiquinone/menaquinone biosynthesis C-methylase UbiE